MEPILIVFVLITLSLCSALTLAVEVEGIKKKKMGKESK